jgi:hypothetical protein
MGNGNMALSLVFGATQQGFRKTNLRGDRHFDRPIIASKGVPLLETLWRVSRRDNSGDGRREKKKGRKRCSADHDP